MAKKKPATRVFIIGNELGYDESSPDFEELAGDNAAREKQATEIKNGIIALCVEAGGTIAADHRQETSDYDDEGEEINAFGCYLLEATFPDEETARRAGEAVKESYGMYGVSITNPNANSECQASFITPDTLGAGERESIREYIKAVCTELGGEAIDSTKFHPAIGTKSILDTYQLPTPENVELAFRRIRDKYSKKQVKFGWEKLKERMPKEKSVCPKKCRRKVPLPPKI